MILRNFISGISLRLFFADLRNQTHQQKAKVIFYFLLLPMALLITSCGSSDLAHSPSLPKNSCVPSFVSGYSDRISYYPGEIMQAYLQSTSDVPSCRLDIYRISGELAFSIPATLFVQQISTNNPSVNGFGFLMTVEIKIPDDIRSGVYLIEKQAPFIVKTRKAVDIVVVYPSNTANAYCTSGGKSLYTTGTDKVGFVSFLRPTSIQENAVSGLNWFSSLPGYEIGFISDGDLDDYSNIRNAKLIAIVGHSEYWTRSARKNFDQFVNEGGHALVLSGNTMWWQVRYTANNQLVRYHELAEDPEEDVLLKTTNWSEPSLQYSILPSIGADFPHGGYGLEKDNGWNGFKITTSLSPLFEGTGLKKGDIIDLPSGEYDGIPIKSWSADGYPIPDNDVLNFNKIELLGYDRGSRFNKETIGTFIVFKRTETSGIILNGASYDWCSASGMGGKNGTILKKITLNAIDKLLKGKPVFSN